MCRFANVFAAMATLTDQVSEAEREPMGSRLQIMAWVLIRVSGGVESRVGHGPARA